jgi:hypothetical protein
MNSYQDNIRPWAIFVRLTDGSNDCVARFKKRSDADAYMSILRRGGGIFEVAFDREDTTQLSSKDCNATQGRH